MADRLATYRAKRDFGTTPEWDAEAHPRSVKSGRTNDDVAAGPDLEWPAGDTAPSRPTYQSIAGRRSTPETAR